MSARQILDDTISEAEFMEQVIELAERSGWLVAHIPDGLYRIAAKHGRHHDMAGAKGLPDLIMAHRTDHSRPLIFAELKKEDGRLSTYQKQWLAALKGFDHSDEVVVRVWRPRDWPEIEELLTKGRVA